MTSKFLAICAVICAFQGAIAKPSGSSAGVSDMSLGNSMSEFMGAEYEYGTFIEKFENAILSMGSDEEETGFSGYLNAFVKVFEDFAEAEVMEEVSAGHGMEVVRQCVMAERENFRLLAGRLEQRVAEARAQMRKIIMEIMGPYIKQARTEYMKLTVAVKQFPSKMMECIRERDIKKAMELVRSTRQTVRESAANIEKIIEEARTKIPEIREQSAVIREQIVNEAKEGLKAIRGNIRKCIVNGGPAEV